jgi:hypothetical protein
MWDIVKDEAEVINDFIFGRYLDSIIMNFGGVFSK